MIENGADENLVNEDDQTPIIMTPYYVEDEYSVTDNFIITAGLRYNHDEYFKGHLTPWSGSQCYCCWCFWRYYEYCKHTINALRSNIYMYYSIFE